MTRELLLNDELQDLEEGLTMALRDKAKLDRTLAQNRELQAEIHEQVAAAHAAGRPPCRPMPRVPPHCPHAAGGPPTQAM